jgi:hypothetical protein
MTPSKRGVSYANDAMRQLPYAFPFLPSIILIVFHVVSPIHPSIYLRFILAVYLAFTRSGLYRKICQFDVLI